MPSYRRVNKKPAIRLDKVVVLVVVFEDAHQRDRTGIEGTCDVQRPGFTRSRGDGIDDHHAAELRSG